MQRNRAVIKYLLLIILAGSFYSCKDKTVDYGLDEYYVEIVTAQSDNSFLSDNGIKIVAKSDVSNKSYSSGDRVLINYTLLEASNPDYYYVRINGSAKIPQGKLTLSDNSTIQTSVKEPVLLESVWLGNHYLNMQFYINFKSTAHKIGLLVDSASIKSETISLYFVHDPVNDSPGFPSHTYLSFDLKEVLGQPKKNRSVSVQINTSNYGIKTCEFEY